MTTKAIDITARRKRTSPLPHLPASCRDPLDDIRELLFSFDAKQAGQSDTCYADLCESMAAALRTTLAVLTRPAAKPVLRPMALLELAQVDKFLLDLERHSDSITSADPAAVAYLLGQAERHLARTSDLVHVLTGLPR